MKKYELLPIHKQIIKELHDDVKEKNKKGFELASLEVLENIIFDFYNGVSEELKNKKYHIKLNHLGTFKNISLPYKVSSYKERRKEHSRKVREQRLEKEIQDQWVDKSLDK